MMGAHGTNYKHFEHIMMHPKYGIRKPHQKWLNMNRKKLTLLEIKAPAMEQRVKCEVNKKIVCFTGLFI